MPVRKITRRSLLAGVSAGAALASAPAIARNPLRRGGKPTAADTPIATITYANTAGTDAPADVAYPVMVAFKQGDIPAGSIAVPQVGGADQFYQASNRSYWGDGSLRMARFYITRTSALAAGATIQFSFVARTGSYLNDSDITLSDITGASDHKIVVTNCHSAQPARVADRMFAVRIGGGEITGVKVFHPSNMTIGTNNVTGSGGTGGQISISAGTPTIVNPGSGYALTNTTGTFTAAFNDIVAGVAADGNRTNGRSIEQYAKGPVCDAWVARTTVAGFPHFHVSIFVERWKKPDGSFLAFRRNVVYGNGTMATGSTLVNYTYDLDWQDGATVIYGASGGDTRFQTIFNFPGASGQALSLEGQPNWSANSAAYNAIEQRRTPSECLYFRATKVPLPYEDLVPTKFLPATLSAWELVTQDSGIAQTATYHPMGNAGIRSGLGAGGIGNQESPMNELDNQYWMCLRNNLHTEARKWLRNIRIASAHSYSLAQQGSAMYEPTTMYPANVIPASVQTFTGMTPTRESIDNVNFTSTGYSHPLIGSGNMTDFATSAWNTYHQMCASYGAYIIEGEQWQLENLLHSAATPTAMRRPAFYRQGTIGSTIYYGIFCGRTNNIRDQAWWKRSAGYAVACMPETFDDGSDNVVRQNIAYTLHRHHEWLNDLIAHTGTVKIGLSGAATTKAVDYTGTGWYPENFNTTVGMEFCVPFMENYEVEVSSHLAVLFGGTTTGTAIRAFLEHMKPRFVKSLDGAGSHYYALTYRLKGWVDRTNPAIADTTWSRLYDAANPGPASFAQNTSRQPVSFNFTSGSSTVAVRISNGTASNVAADTTQRLANGSRIQLTPLNTESYSNLGNPPAGTDVTTWYYWKELTTTTGELHTNAALTAPITPTETKNGVYFWIVPANTPPADNSGLGSHNSGADNSADSRLCVAWATLRLMKWAGVPDDGNGNITEAIANTELMWSSIPGTNITSLLANRPQYAWATSVD